MNISGITQTLVQQKISEKMYFETLLNLKQQQLSLNTLT